MTHTHITAEQPIFHLGLRDLWRYRDLTFLFTKKSLTVSYKQTILGPLWLIINPLLSSFVYMILFGRIAGLGTEGVPQFLFYLTGTSLWGYFSGCFQSNSTLFTSNAGLFGKVYFPRLTVPLSNILTAMVRLGVQLGMVVILVLYYTAAGKLHPDPVWLLAFPVVLVHCALLALGCGLILSALTARYRDLAGFIPVGTQLWMYATPVVYPLSTIPAGTIRRFVLLNPVTMDMELLRRALLGVGSVQPRYRNRCPSHEAASFLRSGIRP